MDNREQKTRLLKTDTFCSSNHEGSSKIGKPPPPKKNLVKVEFLADFFGGGK